MPRNLPEVWQPGWATPGVRTAALLALALTLVGCGGDEPSAGSDATVSAEPAAPPAGPSLEEAGCDVERASKVVEQCKVCHSVEAGAANLTGPNLYGVVGRAAASKDGFAYSKVLRESGIVWDLETLDAFLASPLTYLPNNRMAFGGVTNADDRQAIVCLLNTLR